MLSWTKKVKDFRVEILVFLNISCIFNIYRYD